MRTWPVEEGIRNPLKASLTSWIAATNGTVFS